MVPDRTSFSESRIFYDPPVDKYSLLFLRLSLLYLITLGPFLPVVTLSIVLFGTEYDVAVGAMILAAIPWLYFAWPLSKRFLRVIVNPSVTYPSKPKQPDDELDDWGYKPDRLSNSTYYGAIDGERRLLVLRGVDDEASLTLAVGAFGSRATHFLLRTILPNGMVFSAMVGGLLAMLGWMSSYVQSAILVGFMLVTSIMLMLPGIFRGVFGREMLFGAWRCEISSNSAPDAVRGMEVVTLPESAQASPKSLRHYLHGHPDVIPSIVEWLAPEREEKSEKNLK